MNPLRHQIIQEARSWLRTPYHHAACVKGLQGGVDCAWLLIGVFRELKLVPDDINPGRYPYDWALHRNEERYLNMVRRYAKREVSEPLQGDVALYRYGRCVAHGVIVVDWPNIIHATSGLKMVGEDSATEGFLQHRKPVGFFSMVEA